MATPKLAGLGLFALGQVYLATHNPILQVTSETISGEFDDLLCLIRGALSFGMCKVYAPMLMPLAAIQIGIGLVLAHGMPFKEYMVIALLFALCAGSTFYNRDVDSETIEQFNKRLLSETKKQIKWGGMGARTPPTFSNHYINSKKLSKVEEGRQIWRQAYEQRLQERLGKLNIKKKQIYKKK